MNADTVYKQVQAHYGSIAQAENPSHSSAIAQAFGYTEEELKSIPRDANLGLSCGNPLAIASLREGETVIDLGSGAGFDVFLAAKKVGQNGRAIGVDMNKNMLARARENHQKSGGANNVSFIEGKITSIPLENTIADCIISNCVINLVPEAEKPAVFTEIARLLKPGGRVAVSDILARKPFPTELRESVAAYVGCVAGCSPKQDYERFLAENGFSDIAIIDTESDLNVYIDMSSERNQEIEQASGCCGSSTAESVSGTVRATPCCSELHPTTTDDVGAHRSLANIDLNEWAGSFKIFAVKS
ncbi:NAD(P)-binding protein [Aaosphaeria arxii CBS 175.79]|uniref:Arsenite methyltransferase n=1 Tax=Aaosphaeria arxii CBS 175.79 TaxID=1450172 RepID=A0A6A5X925_9PLEO|nr:NAD(P)-binding protein [Aaosphaeria arxii CBS 175.79]KAF2009468.1 NAD(P)-binding protein [Aaosphaeria arxii CBS 175.79]